MLTVAATAKFTYLDEQKRSIINQRTVTITVTVCRTSHVKKLCPGQHLAFKCPPIKIS